MDFPIATLGGLPGTFAPKTLLLTALDKFDLVTFRRVNESNSTAIRRMWSVRQRITLCRSVFGEFVEIFDLKSKVGEIVTNDNRAASVEFAYLNFLITARGFQEHKFRSPPGGRA